MFILRWLVALTYLLLTNFIIMSILAKVKEVLTSKYFVIGAAAVAVVVWFKGMPFIAGVALGVSGAKLITAFKG
jgi:hypothetical protein